MKNTPSKKQLREFGYLIGFGFPIIIGLFIPFIIGHGFRNWTLYFGLPFLILALIQPITLLYPFKLWMFLGHILGWINSRIILSLIFFIVLIPIAFIMRLFGYDPMRKKTINGNSYRELRNNNKIDLKRIF